MVGIKHAMIAAAIGSMAFALCPQFGNAKNFGAYGTVFPVIEPDLLEEILSRFRAMEADGGLAKMEKDMQDHTKAYLEEPKPASFLPRAKEARAFNFDPSITLDRDLADQNGRVFARAGTRINPLDYSGFDKRIVVLDGGDAAQVAYAIQEGDELDTLMVITKGLPLELMRKHGRRFWFDQDAVITTRFDLEYLPSVITREGDVLRIEEIVVREMRE